MLAAPTSLSDSDFRLQCHSTVEACRRKIADVAIRGGSEDQPQLHRIWDAMGNHVLLEGPLALSAACGTLHVLEQWSEASPAQRSSLERKLMLAATFDAKGERAVRVLGFVMGLVQLQLTYQHLHEMRSKSPAHAPAQQHKWGAAQVELGGRAASMARDVQGFLAGDLIPHFLSQHDVIVGHLQDAAVQLAALTAARRSMDDFLRMLCSGLQTIFVAAMNFFKVTTGPLSKLGGLLQLHLLQPSFAVACQDLVLRESALHDLAEHATQCGTFSGGLFKQKDMLPRQVIERVLSKLGGTSAVLAAEQRRISEVVGGTLTEVDWRQLQAQALGPIIQGLGQFAGVQQQMLGMQQQMDGMFGMVTALYNHFGLGNAAAAAPVPAAPAAAAPPAQHLPKPFPAGDPHTGQQMDQQRQALGQAEEHAAAAAAAAAALPPAPAAWQDVSRRREEVGRSLLPAERSWVQVPADGKTVLNDLLPRGALKLNFSPHTMELLLGLGREELFPRTSDPARSPIPAREWKQPSVARMTLMPAAAEGGEQLPPAAALEVWGVALPRRPGDPTYTTLMYFVETGSLQAIEDDEAAVACWVAVFSRPGLSGRKGKAAEQKAALRQALTVSTTVVV